MHLHPETQHDTLTGGGFFAYYTGRLTIRELVAELFAGLLQGGIRNFLADPDTMPAHTVKSGTEGKGDSLLFSSQHDAN